jgi:hypothetical protein
MTEQLRWARVDVNFRPNALDDEVVQLEAIFNVPGVHALIDTIEAYTSLNDVIWEREADSTLRFDPQLRKWRALDPTSADVAELKQLIERWRLPT